MEGGTSSSESSTFDLELAVEAITKQIQKLKGHTELQKSVHQIKTWL